MKNLIPSVKGARDFYPEEKRIHRWLYKNIQTVSEKFGYQEYEGPYLERIDLYAAKSGEELVKEQAFVLTDRGGELLTLRPELTPSLARMVAQKQGSLSYPLRWWAFGPFWRYEKPQKGRSREFFQWNIDMIGINSAEADCELLLIVVALFEQLGFKPDQVVLKINDRKLMDEVLLENGVSAEQKKDVFRWIDRSDKMNKEAWMGYGSELGIAEQSLAGLEKALNDQDLWKRSEYLAKIFNYLSQLNKEAFVQFDAHIIRGLDYYTGVVFEAKDLDGGRALLGGGHYDNLVEDVGGDALPGVGFAMGDVMMIVTLEKYGLIPTSDANDASVLVTVFDESSFASSMQLAQLLREGGLPAILYPVAAKLPKQFKFADKLGTRYVIVQGPDEIQNNSVNLKDLRNGTQVNIPVSDLVATITAAH